MTKKELKECPFCGSKAIYEEYCNLDYYEVPFMFCDSCKALFTVEGSEDWVTPVDDGMDRLREHWNMRADSSSPSTSAKALVHKHSESEPVTAFHYVETYTVDGKHAGWKDEVDAVLNFSSISDAARHFGLTAGYVSQMLDCSEIRQRGKLRGYQFKYQNGPRKRRKNV